MLSTVGNNKILNALIIAVTITCSCPVISPFQLYGQSVPYQFYNFDYLQYENSNYNITLPFPSTWNITEGNNSINFSSPLEGKSDLFREGLVIEILPSRNTARDEMVSLDINELRQTLENFTLIYSDANFTVSNSTAYKIIYTYTNNTISYEAMRIWVVIGRNTYTISYNAESGSFDSYFPTIENMIGLLRVEAPEKPLKPVQQTAGLRLRNNPYNIAVDAYINRMYITNLRSEFVSVIDGQKDKLLSDIKVGAFPSAIAVDPDSGKLYVANRDSNSVSVIDGSTYTVIANIPVGAKPTDIAIDANEAGINTLIFVSNSESDSVSVIDGSTYTVIATLEVRDQPDDIAVDAITNRLYAVNHLSNTVSVIDYYLSSNEGLRNETVPDIQVGEGPASINFNPITNKGYVSNSESDSVSVINSSTNEVIDNIQVGTTPYGIGVNTDKNLIYVANFHSNTVSVIDGSTNEVNNTISVSEYPFAISYNPVNKITYVTHLSQNILSMMYNTNPVIGVTFEINPANSGYVSCNETEFLDGDYFRYNISTPLDCIAVPNAGFSFSSWSGDLTSNPINSSQTTFEVSRLGNITANFVVPVEFTIPKEFWDQLWVIMGGIITSIIASWSIPALANWHHGKKQREHLGEFMREIYNARDKISSKEPIKYSGGFEKIRNSIEEALANGGISESQYDILNNKILEYSKPSE